MEILRRCGGSLGTLWTRDHGGDGVDGGAERRQDEWEVVVGERVQRCHCEVHAGEASALRLQRRRNERLFVVLC